MNRTFKIFLIVLGVVLLTVYFVCTIIFVHKNHKEVVCNSVEICVTDSAKRQFVNSRDVERYLLNIDLYPLHKNYSDVSCSMIEHCLKDYDLIENAECYKTPNGEVVISIEQREPFFRVMNGENFYVDINRKVMPVRSSTATRVPIVTGRCSKQFATEEMYDFVTWLTKNDFWNAQIVQINVTANKDIELIPRVGNSTIILGKLDNYESKLDKLMTLYTQGFNVVGWTPYKEIDLRFHNQVIGRK